MRVLITGASRGIGASIAKFVAKKHGGQAMVSLLGRSLRQPVHDELDGTLLDTAASVEREGAVALPFQVDMRCGEELTHVLRNAVNAMGGIDVLVNNASALYATRTLPPRRMDLMYQVNTRGALLCMQTCHPLLEESKGSIVTLSPPLNLAKLQWLSDHPAYTISKYSMTLATIAHASRNVRANCIWPRYTVATSATHRLETRLGVRHAYTRGRDPMDVAEAVYKLAVAKRTNARTFYDDEIVTLPTTDAPLDVFAEERGSYAM